MNQSSSSSSYRLPNLKSLVNSGVEHGNTLTGEHENGGSGGGLKSGNVGGDSLRAVKMEFMKQKSPKSSLLADNT